MKKQRVFLSLLCVIVLMVTLIPSVSAASGVTCSTASISGSTAQLAYIDMISGRQLIPVIANDSIHTDEPIRDIVDGIDEGTVVAATCGGFFNAYYTGAELSIPDNYPQVYSTIVKDGKVISNGGTICAIGFSCDGELLIDRVTLSPTITFKGRDTFTGWSANKPQSDATAIYFLTDAFNYPVNIDASSKIVIITNDTVSSVTSGRASFVTPDGCIAAVFNSSAWANAEKWGTHPQVGDNAVYAFSATPESTSQSAWLNAKTVVAGGNLLVQNGVNVCDSNTNITDEKQQLDVIFQRTFIAKMKDGRLLIGTANSSFRNIADWLVSNGAQSAINLDGGASSALYVDGKGYLTSPGRELATMLAVVDGASGTAAKASSPSAWAVSSVEQARSLSILPSKLDSNYQSNITRAEFCDLIAGFFYAKTGTTMKEHFSSLGLSIDDYRFTDASSENVRYCCGLGIVNGVGDNKFNPNGAILRQDAAAMLMRLANVLDVSSGNVVQSFADSADISSYAVEAVTFVTSLKVMNGDGTNFNPRNNITREQAVITMINAMENYN